MPPKRRRSTICNRSHAATFAALPQEFRALTGEIVFVVEDFPDETSCATWSSKASSKSWAFSMARTSRSAKPITARRIPTMILLYRRPILDYWAEHHERLGDVVRHVLVHEIGHHFGLSDEDMEGIEGQAG